MPSATMWMTRTLIENHGYNVWKPWGYEFFVNKRMRRNLCSETLANGSVVTHLWALQPLRRLRQAESVLAGSLRCDDIRISADRPTIFLVKGKGVPADVRKKLLDWADPSVAGATFIYRMNRLDRTICSVKDCYTLRLGSPVDADGNRSSCMRSGIKGADGSLDTHSKVFINASMLMKKLQRSYSNIALPMLDGYRHRYKDPVVSSTEDLLQYEYAYDAETLARSTAAWAEQLQGLGVRANLTIVEQTLRGAQREQGSERTHHSHAVEIYNAHEVKAALEEAGPGLLQFWRD